MFRPAPTPALLGLSLALTVLAPVARAQTPPAAAAGRGLNLSPAQLQKVQARGQQFAIAMDALGRDKTLTPAQKQARAVALRKALDQDELTYLTPPQRAKVMRQRQVMAQQSKKFQQAHAADIATAKKLGTQIESSLTPQQKQQMTAIKAAAQTQAQQIVADKTLAPPQKQQKLLALQSDAQTKSLAVLTPTQRAKFTQIQKIQQRLQAEVAATTARINQQTGF